MTSITPPPIDLPSHPGRINPELYIDRELAWIDFNQRVLEEAQTPTNPLLERVKFLAIFSSNLDEFFMTRVSGVMKQVDAGVSRRPPSGLSLQEQYRSIRQRLLPLVAECQRLWSEELQPALHDQGIKILRLAELSADQQSMVQAYYEQEIFPVLTPLAIDANHPFPFVSNLNINLLVVIQGEDDTHLYARVKVPEVLPRLIRLNVAKSDAGEQGSDCFVFLEDIIRANLANLFPGRQVLAVYAFRVTRDTDQDIQEDEASDLLETMEEHVRQRRFGAVVRLSLESTTSAEVRTSLMENLDVDDDAVYTIDGILRQSDLMQLYSLDYPDLKDPSFMPVVPPSLREEDDVFTVLRTTPVLLHLPFNAFSTLIDLVWAAARDPQVLAIKMTLYRVGRNSPIVEALMAAREEGKQVAVLVELKARFDEENNIEWARAMEAVGVHVVYGLKGLKTHAKLLTIIRKEPDGLRRYVHLGTGNYNATTARLYTDIGLLTADPELGADVGELFNVLTGYSQQTHYRKLLVAPHSLRQSITAMIEREIDQYRETGKAHIIFKINALTDEQMVMALYRAARAGVTIDLIIRGICCLRPGIPGLSETVKVRSIVGRFLEHSRIYYFYNGGQQQIWLGSADLMDRNLDRRVETVFPIESAEQIRYLRDVVLDLYLHDNTHARELQSDGTFVRLSPVGTKPVDAQLALLEQVMRDSTARKG